MSGEPVFEPEGDDDLTPGLVVAVDGPSGSGKSTVCRALAEVLHLAYLDTGAMYRAATWWCLSEEIDLADTATVAETVRALEFEVFTDPAAPRIAVNGHDVTEAIRESRISAAVSKIATNLAARANIVERQRQLVARGRARRLSHDGIVAEGRDITTVVAPDADVRILLTATPESRLARRAADVHGKADAATMAATSDEVLRRDRDDSTVAQFMEANAGVHTIDNSLQTPEETLAAVLELVKQARPETVGEAAS